jgi:3D (Asp-Asp-Asp) domain-containing protein
MERKLYVFLFRYAKAFRDYKWSLVFGCPIIGLLLLVYTVSSLAETPRQHGKDESMFAPSSAYTYDSQASSLHTREVSAMELVPLSLAPAETTGKITAIAAKKNPKNDRTLTRKKKSSRSESMTKVQEGMVFVANASAYTGPGKTKLGTKVRPGIVAVDPDYIPLGTVLWVEGYGTCRAEDTGSSIKGNKIDLVFPSEKEALEWGRKDVQVKVISVPE